MYDDTLLIVLNPRYLPECILSLEQVQANKVWVKNYTERELETLIPEIITASDLDYYVIVSDDVICSTDAYNAVCRELHKDPDHVYTGYCNLDSESEDCSITKSPPTLPIGVETYDWMTLDYAFRYGEPLIRTYHPSMALTGMSRRMWSRFPWQCYSQEGTAGWAADLNLALRLDSANVPIYAPRDSFIFHTKPQWKLADSQIYTRRRLRVGVEQRELVWGMKSA